MLWLYIHKYTKPNAVPEANRKRLTRFETWIHAVVLFDMTVDITAALWLSNHKLELCSLWLTKHSLNPKRPQLQFGVWALTTVTVEWDEHYTLWLSISPNYPVVVCPNYRQSMVYCCGVQSPTHQLTYNPRQIGRYDGYRYYSSSNLTWLMFQLCHSSVEGWLIGVFYLFFVVESQMLN